jgi:hypothetical protein
MLYEFHRQQNAKKPGSVHATYLLSGLRKRAPPPAAVNDDKSDAKNDIDMDISFSSLPDNSQANPDSADEQIVTRSIVLAREEDLERMCSSKCNFAPLSTLHALLHSAFQNYGLDILFIISARPMPEISIEAQATFTEINSIHIYSLGPHSLKVSSCPWRVYAFGKERQIQFSCFSHFWA